MPVVCSSVGWYCLVALVISSREDNEVKALASSAGWRTAWRQKGECQAKKSGRKGTQSMHIHIQSWYLSSCYQLNKFFLSFGSYSHFLWIHMCDDRGMSTERTLWTKGLWQSCYGFSPSSPRNQDLLKLLHCFSLQWESLPVFMFISP